VWPMLHGQSLCLWCVALATLAALLGQQHGVDVWEHTTLAIVTLPSSLLSSSSLRMANWMWRGTMRFFLLSRAALPARLQHFCSQILQHCCHVHWGTCSKNVQHTCKIETADQ